jgi:UDP-N-acetylglucosamine--N-acetylmuramyl-(pentapeptide) pyrophosphoryl-undecaprenol N-acetylglucosamine transferase
MSLRPVLLAAGGTGGHLFPAQALGDALAKRGIAVELVTDDRAARFGAQFPARAIHQLKTASPSGGSPLKRLKAIARLILATRVARRLIRRIRPLAVVGFGGYPTVPPVLAASQLDVPAILHEQNAVMGRANRFLAKRVTAIAKGFETLGGADAAGLAKAHHTGNPVRPTVLAAALTPYPDFADGRLHLLVTGGSQGARIMSEIVPAAVALLDPALRARLSIVQQARAEDEAAVRAAYAALGVAAEVKVFFDDLPMRMAAAHLVVARSGASTVSELAVIGRPSLLVPFPHALDQDQAANAACLAVSGAAEVVPQASFTPPFLATALEAALADPDALRRRADAAAKAGIADAADRLADLVEALLPPPAERETP